MSLRTTAAALAAALAAAAPAAAQIPGLRGAGIEVRGGLVLPAGDLKAFGDGESGTSFSANASVGVSSVLGIYAGYSRSTFDIRDLPEQTYTDRGFAVGVRADFPTPHLPIDPWVRAGLVNHVFAIHGSQEEDPDTEPTWGYELGAGVALPLAGPVSLTPGITFTRTSPQEVEISHTRFDVGLRVRL